MGGMVVSRALPGSDIAEDVREAALADASGLWLDSASQARVS
ncbi:hypothetical protein AAG612_05920 [Citromicrobium bathyomarinum]